MDKNKIVKNTKLAFNVLQKLYFEISYFILEVEGLLSKEDEGFVIGKSGGYAISSPSSTGLEPQRVKIWPLRKMGVFFVPQDLTEVDQGITVTDLLANPKILYLHINLDDQNLIEPNVYIGVFYHISSKRFKKFEQAMRHIEENDSRIFADSDLIDYEDASIKFKGKILKNNLFDINSRNDIGEMITKPALKLFREI